ncbi:hypothetical protein [Cytobacillus sp. IB215316]|uniref:hypothetical protein n=1 Tax=Cytobacillus sp. IB215316 TaxID=3097354 RepID=UPI002A11A64E|nr:hypothetical protein [Cytobacillus sp. IB215316]MDX8360764.1 hypothetical protein [Cytobacillus sp. IB215316]
MQIMLFLLIALTLTMLVVVAVLVSMEKKNNTKAKKQGTKKQGLIPISTYFRIYKLLDNLFFTRGSINKIRTRLSELSVYTNLELRVMAVKFYLVSSFASVGLVVTGAIIFQDLFSILLVLAYAIVMKNVLVDKQIDSVHFKILKQLSIALSSVRQNYLRLGSIPDSITEAEIGSELQRAFEDIYLILTAIDGEQRLDEFYASTPFKLLQTFAGTCFILNNSGDAKLDDGSSSFIQSMGMIADEVNLEIRRISTQKAKFGKLEYLPIAPVGVIGLIENYFSNTIPGTSVIYNGSTGYIFRVVIVVSSIIAYLTIARINSAVTVKKDDRNIVILWLLSKKTFRIFIEDIMPKKYKKLLRKNKAIKGSLSMIDIPHLYASKFLYASIAFILSIAITIFAIGIGKEFVYENTREVSLLGGEKLTQEDIDKRLEMDEYFLSLPVLPSERDTLLFVEEQLPELEEYDKSAQVKRLQQKYTDYHNAEIKWWMLAVCFVISLICWKIPDIILIARAWVLKTESEEDVLQMQTIIAILMNTSSDTLDTIYWLERQSRVHKNALIDAYHEYPSNPELSLNRLKNKSVVGEFKRLVDKLILTIHQITLKEAFSDLISERNHVMRIREMSQETTIMRKRAIVSPIAMLPLYLTIFLYIMIPLGILGYKEFIDTMSNM